MSTTTDRGPNMRRIVRTQRLLAEMGHADVVEALEELRRLRALTPAQPVAAEGEAPLRAAVESFIRAVQTQHDTREVPLKYTVPWGALNDLIAALASLQAGVVVPASPSVQGASPVGGRAVVPSGQSPAVSAVPASIPGAEAENRKLRRMLCAAHCGRTAYTDDGEASDASVWPFIDFLRDSPDEIQSKLRGRAEVARGVVTPAGGGTP